MTRIPTLLIIVPLLFSSCLNNSHVASETMTPSVLSLTDKKIQFSGYNWYVKERAERAGPGGNFWSGAGESVWVDDLGQLHLKIIYSQGKWYCAEIYSEDFFGWGSYSFSIDGRPDNFDQNVVLGMFIYRDDQHEYDIEFSRWGEMDSPNGWYVAHPNPQAGEDIFGYSFLPHSSLTTHRILWEDSLVTYDSRYTEGRELIKEWAYKKGRNYFDPSQERVHLNLWLVRGMSPSDGNEVEIIVTEVQLP